MAWRICFVFNGKRFCINIPILVRRFELPEPDPWIITDLIKERFVKDLQILATIDQLSSGLSAGVKKQVQDTLRRSVEAGGLPEGIKVDFGKEKPGA
jgi:hypothetical protein